MPTIPHARLTLSRHLRARSAPRWAALTVVVIALASGTGWLWLSVERGANCPVLPMRTSTEALTSTWSAAHTARLTDIRGWICDLGTRAWVGVLLAERGGLSLQDPAVEHAVWQAHQVVPRHPLMLATTLNIDLQNDEASLALRRVEYGGLATSASPDAVLVEMEKVAAAVGLVARMRTIGERLERSADAHSLVAAADARRRVGDFDGARRALDNAIALEGNHDLAIATRALLLVEIDEGDLGAEITADLATLDLLGDAASPRARHLGALARASLSPTMLTQSSMLPALNPSRTPTRGSLSPVVSMGGMRGVQSWPRQRGPGPSTPSASTSSLPSSTAQATPATSLPPNPLLKKHVRAGAASRYWSPRSRRC